MDSHCQFQRQRPGPRFHQTSTTTSQRYPIPAEQPFNNARGPLSLLQMFPKTAFIDHQNTSHTRFSKLPAECLSKTSRINLPFNTRSPHVAYIVCVELHTTKTLRDAFIGPVSGHKNLPLSLRKAIYHHEALIGSLVQRTRTTVFFSQV